MERGIHKKIAETFPGMIAEGWRYRGCSFYSLGPAPFVALRFTKVIVDREAYAEVKLAVETFNDPFFAFRGFVCDQLQAQDRTMGERRARELDAA